MLWRQGQPRPIRRKVFDLLLLLIDQRPQTLSHERIAREVWGSKALAAKHVARAVMEARREIGDSSDSPRYILSVRGVGYRFSGDVTLAEVGEVAAPEGADAGARSARDDIDAAAACLRRADYEEARRLVDRAMSHADLAGARPELGRAMALAASILLRVGSNEHALTLATKAMRLAQIEGRSDMLAAAQLGLAEVQLWRGSPHAALDHLQAAHAVWAPQGPSHDLRRCERALADTYRQIDRPDEAWPRCERAEALALQLEPETRAVHERLLKVAILHNMIEAADAEGRSDDVHRHALTCLELLDRVEPDTRVTGSRVFETASRTYRAYTLEWLGRVDEAWSVLEQLRPILFAHDDHASPLMEMRRNEFRQIEASLLSRAGRHLEAMRAMDECIAQATCLSTWSMELASAQSLAARICERAGRYKEALKWMRLQQRTSFRLYADRAQATADIMRAQLESDRLGEDLSQARAEVQRLQQANHDLEQRIAQFDRHSLLDEGGLAPAASLIATINVRAALARKREMPLCLGIVQLSVSADTEPSGTDFLLRRRLKLLSSTLKNLIPEASAAAEWRRGVYFFIIYDMGLGPARQRCQALVHRLNADVVPTAFPEPAMNFRGDAVDITQYAGVEAALGSSLAPD